MKTNNYHFWGSEEDVKRLSEEYRYMGRHILVEPGHLTVFALPPKKVKKKSDDRGKTRVSEAGNSSEDRQPRKDDRRSPRR